LKQRVLGAKTSNLGGFRVMGSKKYTTKEEIAYKEAMDCRVLNEQLGVISGYMGCLDEWRREAREKYGFELIDSLMLSLAKSIDAKQPF
jgi:hypothetical protein